MTAVRQEGRRSVNDRLIKFLLRGAILVAFLTVWQLIGNDEIRLSMPTFLGSVRAIIEMTRDGSLLEGLWITNQALIVGYILTVVIGLPLGITMALSPKFERIAKPYITILLTAPTIALVPIIQAAFGLSFAARVAIVFLFSFIYLTVNTIAGVRTIDPSFVEMARSYGADRFQQLRLVVLPAAVPGIMAGVRLALGRAMIGMVIAELTLVGAGIGSLIVDYQVRFQPAYVFGIVLVVVIQGVILMNLARRLENRLSKWKGSVSVG